MTSYRDRLLAGVYNGEPTEEAVAPEEEQEENGGFTCEECGREFGTEHGLKIHQTKTHAAEVEPTGYMQ